MYSYCTDTRYFSSFFVFLLLIFLQVCYMPIYFSRRRCLDKRLVSLPLPFRWIKTDEFITLNMFVTLWTFWIFSRLLWGSYQLRPVSIVEVPHVASSAPAGLHNVSRLGGCCVLHAQLIVYYVLIFCQLASACTELIDSSDSLVWEGRWMTKPCFHFLTHAWWVTYDVTSPIDLFRALIFPEYTL